MEKLVEYEDSSESDECMEKNAASPEFSEKNAALPEFPEKNTTPPAKILMDKGKQIEEEECTSALISCHDFSHEASSSSAPSSSIRNWFIDMGCPPNIIDKALTIYGTKDEDVILEYILACQAADYSSDSSNQNLNNDLGRIESDENYNLKEDEVISEDQLLGHPRLKTGPAEEFYADDIRAQLLEMGFPENVISAAIEVNGVDTPIHELVDFMYAYLRDTEDDKCVAEDHEGMGDAVFQNCGIQRKNKQDGETYKSRKRKQDDIILSDLKMGSSSDIILNGFETGSSSVPNTLMGFGVPGHPVRGRSKELKPCVLGPPFFYFESVAIVQKDFWMTISRHFDDVEPEFVDSKYFSASRRPRGYVHNLPIEGRFQALPLPPMTIQEAFPQTKQYWPSWDNREKMNCISSGRASDALCQELRSIIKKSEGKPSLSEQAYILDICKNNNLVWVGPDKMSPLEPHEIELILGYEKDYTRGVSCMTDRLQCLADSFQIDTVAYHLSVLKPCYPNGIKVLSLFSGIGGAEVALYRIGIHLKCVVSVELCPDKRLVLSSWWKKTHQTGTLIQKENVQNLTREVLEELIDAVEGFDLIIGSSPCITSGLSGKNKVSQEAPEVRQSSLFYEFPRILNEVRQIMQSKGML